MSHMLFIYIISWAALRVLITEIFRIHNCRGQAAMLIVVHKLVFCKSLGLLNLNAFTIITVPLFECSSANLLALNSQYHTGISCHYHSQCMQSLLGGMNHEQDQEDLQRYWVSFYSYSLHHVYKFMFTSVWQPSIGITEALSHVLNTTGASAIPISPICIFKYSNSSHVKRVWFCKWCRPCPKKVTLITWVHQKSGMFTPSMLLC